MNTDMIFAAFVELLTRDDTEYRHMRVYDCEMGESMKADATNIIQRRFELFKKIDDIAEYIQNQFDSKYYSSHWNCIIAKTSLIIDMVYQVRYTDSRFIFLRICDYEVLLWGIPN